MRRSGFTLIELLVVIAIIAMLAAIMFPVFVSARDWIKQNTDMGNARQVGIALDMYTKEYDDVMPIYHQFNTTPEPWKDGHKGVEMELLPYTKSQISFKSPVDGGSPILANNTKKTFYDAFGTSYHWVACMFTVVPGVSTRDNAVVRDAGWFTSLSQVESTSETRVLRLEMMPFFARYRYALACERYGYDCPGVNSSFASWGSIAGSVIFSDLHAKLTSMPSAFDKQFVTPEGNKSGDPRPDSWTGTWFGVCD